MVECRFAGSVERNEPSPGRYSEVIGHVSRDKETDLPSLLLYIKRRSTGNTGSVQEPDGDTSPLEEVFRQHQKPQHVQGKFYADWYHIVINR